METTLKKKIGITGSNGFLGRHTMWLLSTLSDQFLVVPIRLADFKDEVILNNTIKDLDVLIHLARIHPKDASSVPEIYTGNIDLAKKLINALEITKSKAYVIYASSTQIRKDNEYGRAKKEVGEMLRLWAKKNNSKVTNLIIPNEFGEGGVPERSSVVSTFCQEILDGKKSKITEGSVVSLIHCQDISKAILELLRNPKNEDMELFGVDMKVSDLHKVLSDFKEEYYSDVIPSLKDSLHLALFNNLRWHIFDSEFYPRELVLKSDDRGGLFEMIKEKTGGQVFMSYTKPGVTRGNHYHTRKIERFCVIKGEAEICLRQVGQSKVHTFKVSGDKPVFIDMPTFYTHNIKNVGTDELLTVFWSNEIFDPKDPDTYYITV